MAKPEEVDTYEFARPVLPVGTTLRGKYRIDGVIGTGGMAVVYAATHRNRKRFAVKMLHPEFSTRSEVRARFVREGYVANSVEHPGVVSVLDDDVTEDGSAFLVMELLEGATIEGFAPRSRPLPLRESLAIAYDLLGVLEAAHAKGVVHRDIKPANIFVTRLGQVKVLDFGIARLRDATLGALATGTGATLGTPAFMAPEQALALPSEIDGRTDLWAVGATLFTMLSGSLVHAGDNARQVMIRAATEPARSLASVAPELPAAVVDWVSKALLFDKAARWESACAMRDALGLLQHELFGPFEEGCAKRLFELCAPDLATAPTELSPAGELRSAVRETARTTLDSSQGHAEADPSFPSPSLARTSASRRRTPLALIAVALIALGVGLTFGFKRFARPVEVSLSSARPAAGTTAARSAVAPGPSDAIPVARPATSNPSSSAAQLGSTAKPVSSSPPMNRTRKSGPVTRPLPASSSISAAGSAAATPSEPAPPARSTANPLEIPLE